MDEYFAEDREGYYEKIRQTHELEGDYTYWIEYVAQGILDSVEKVSMRANDLVRAALGQTVHLTPKRDELLTLLKEEGLMTSAQIGTIMKVNRARVNQLVGPSVKAGIVLKEGTTRGARYGLARGLPEK